MPAPFWRMNMSDCNKIEMKHRRLFTLRTMAQMVSMNPERLRSLAAAGKVPRIVIGWRTHLYDAEAVIAALRRQSVYIQTGLE